ncbi:MAG TPA: hypothetical protein VMF03_16960 [Steroidobacteraceae bacterium]|nr:hypothetical protein [Steroidobacteraceae bacterium]
MTDLRNMLRCAPLPLLVILAVLAGPSARAAADGDATRTQLSIGYSLLYQEAEGIPKLKWLLMFKDKPRQMSHLTHELIDYYQHLAGSLKRLSEQYPAVRIDVTPMSDIEAAARKAIGADQAKAFAPLVGKSGVDFEREALLMFADALNEQRHLVAVMLERESDPGLHKFLQSTQDELDVRHTRVEELLNRRYFVH